MNLSNNVYILGKKIDIKGDCSNLNRLVPKLLWFSYRQDFPKIMPTSITTDSGWGCTIRTAQMLFANIILTHKHGKDHLNFEEENRDDFIDTRFEIIQMFNDNEESTFSIHNITTLGRKFNINIGSWHGPNMLASIFSQLFEQSLYENGKLKLYISNDGMIYKDQIFNHPAEAYSNNAISVSK